MSERQDDTWQSGESARCEAWWSAGPAAASRGDASEDIVLGPTELLYPSELASLCMSVTKAAGPLLVPLRLLAVFISALRVPRRPSWSYII